MKICMYIGDGNFLLKRSSEGEIPLTKDDIQRILSLKERATREFLNKMIENNIIKLVLYCDEKAYLMNPNYFMYGKWLNECVAYAFKEEIRANIVNDREKDLFERYISKIKNKPKIIK